ncbi:MAG: hypothetical protein QY871_01165 [Dehalococcoides mccartyi]|uniref:hypothetical protein n=1 Tax=Dehalococcoides mccartyi TaxID=61435 RepID=UPI0025C86676|nr:hypothetical protein [Dehalococcoides mccartyi]MDN4185672.1 hypothetical protein [Dehalococcoides mccartyi]
MTQRKSEDSNSGTPKDSIMPSTEEDTEEFDVSPLLVIDRTHEARYGTIKLLEALFNGLANIFPQLPRNTQFMGRVYLQRLIIELTCQYVEEVGRYSRACLETGLLYAQRMISVTTGEIATFYSQKVDNLTDDDIRRMFNVPSNADASMLDLSAMKCDYKKLKEFRAKYHSLYNAMKHGSGVLHKEFSTKDKPMNSLSGTFVSYQWFEVKRGKPTKLQVHTCDGSATESEIRDSELKTEIIPSDSVDEFIHISEDCHGIIAKILKNHAPLNE